MFILQVTSRAIRYWLLAPALLTMTGCATLLDRQTDHPPASEQQLEAWETHRERVEAINDWAFEARAAVRSGMTGGSGRLEWTQVGPVSSLALSGPFDSGRVALTGTSSRMLITDARGNSQLSHDPEGLLEEMTGWQVPLARLPRWVRGLPDTPLDEVSGNDYRLDEHGRLARFSDQQWTVEYDRYESRGDSPALPHFIEMRNDEVRIRLVIDRWNLEAGE